MYRVLIWGCGLAYNKCINVIKYQELIGDIKIVGVTGREQLYKYLDGYPFIKFNDINSQSVDYVVITSDAYQAEIRTRAKEAGFSDEEIVLAKVFFLPAFSFKKYVELLRSRISIIANTCWGGFAYHTLGIKFGSPFINMFENDKDYLKLLTDLRYYLGLKLQFKEYGYNDRLKIEYPICRLDDVELHFNHYPSMEDVEDKWYERVKRINFENLFVMMCTQDRETLERFDDLKYLKKVCFVPFESSLRSSFTVTYFEQIEDKNLSFSDVVSRTASGFFHDYDIIKLLSTGKVNHDRLFKLEEAE